MKAANKTSSLPFALATSAALLMGVSGCSDRNRDLVEASGLAIDDYLQSATVCVDINGNKQCDPDEPHDTTDENGHFSLGTFREGPLLVVINPGVTTESSTQGGIGITVPYDFFLTGPLASSSITPLTTLVQVGVDQGLYPDFATGASAIEAALNIPAGTDIQNYDYIGTGDAKVVAAAKIVTNAIAAAIEKIQGLDLGAVATTENIFETAIKVLIDPDLAGGDGTSLMQEIGIALDAAVPDENGNIDILAVESDINMKATTASEVDETDLETAVEETNTVNEAGGATGATGVTGAN